MTVGFLRSLDVAVPLTCPFTLLPSKCSGNRREAQRFAVTGFLVIETVLYKYH
jgi:hypothetical protein